MAGKGRAPSLAAPNGHEPESHPLGRSQVAKIQRTRILTAMLQEAAERGVANVSVAHVVERAGISRRTFYEIFEDREDCFLEAFDEAIERAAAVVAPAYEAPGPWRSKTRAGLTALLECLDCDRAMARLLIVESLAAGPRALGRRQNVLIPIVSVVERGRTEDNGGAEPPPLTAEGVVGGVLSVLHARLTEREPRDLIELVGPLMGMIVLPYLGPAAARREIERPHPTRASRRPSARRDPLQELDLRLTYRTVRVLMAIAEQPRGSNRVVGEGAGIADAGQISKLLTRLCRFGLIENQGAGAAARGEPNAWTLTEKGKEVQDAIAGQAARG
jgi:AcrR family transcriptional regulator